MGRVLYEELFRVGLGLVLALIVGIIAYNVVVNAFAEAARQTVAP